MTDKQIIETLENIKMYCRFHLAVEYDCRGCRFYRNTASERKNHCQLTALIGNMTSDPKDWCMKTLERIINE